MACYYLSWCVGCNPPFVFCGIRLIGLPAPSGRLFIGVCLPFPHAGQPFHRFTPSILNRFRIIRAAITCEHHRRALGGRSVSALEPRLSPYALAGVALLLVGGVSSSLPYSRLESHTPTHQPRQYRDSLSNKNYSPLGGRQHTCLK